MYRKKEDTPLPQEKFLKIYSSNFKELDLDYYNEQY